MRALDELQRVSLLLVLCGLAAIYAASTVYAPPEVSIQEIDESYLGETVVVHGNVTRHDLHDDTHFLDIAGETRKLPGVAFQDPALNVEENRLHRVQGRVSLYEGELELIVQEITPIKSR